MNASVNLAIYAACIFAATLASWPLPPVQYVTVFACIVVARFTGYFAPRPG